MELKEKFLDQFEIFERNLNGSGKLFVHEIRKDALKSFQELGFPTRKNEEWKYTNLNLLLKQDFTPFTAHPEKPATANIDTYDDIEANKLVFIDGFYAEGASNILESEGGLVISNLAAEVKNNPVVKQNLSKFADYKGNSLTALNMAFAQDGAVISIPKDYIAKYPILLIYVSTDLKRISQPRNLVLLQENSECQIVENFQNPGGSKTFSNTVTEIIQKENSALDYYKIGSQENKDAHIGTTYVSQGPNSHFNSHLVNLGGDLVRNNISVTLNGENCESHIYGLYVLDNKDHVDNHVLVNHAKPHCMSNQLFKGLLSGQSTGVFNGKILVEQDAQKTNAFQSNKNMLLSERATVNSKPQLEIFADDVKCSHGSTSGQINPESVFYLRSRGLNEEQARAMLNQGFADEIIEKIKIKELRTSLSKALAKKLNN